MGKGTGFGPFFVPAVSLRWPGAGAMAPAGRMPAHCQTHLEEGAAGGWQGGDMPDCA